MASHARNSISVGQIRSVESFFSRRETREQNVTPQIEGNRVRPDEAAISDTVDLDPPEMESMRISCINNWKVQLTPLKPNTSPVDPSSANKKQPAEIGLKNKTIS